MRRTAPGGAASVFALEFMMELTGLLLALGSSVAIMLMMHRIAKTKTLSDSMLRTYESMLSDARQQQARAGSQKLAKNGPDGTLIADSQKPDPVSETDSV